MWRYFELLSLKSNDEVASLKAGHPKEAKVALALELVGRYHNKTEALAAKEEFERLFGAGKRSEVPSEIPEYHFREAGLSLLAVMVQCELAPSNSEAKRLIRSDSVSVDGNRVAELDYHFSAGTFVIRVGKKRWARIVNAS